MVNTHKQKLKQMKAMLRHIRLSGVKKHVDKATAENLMEYLEQNGCSRSGGLFTLNEHQFVFEGGGQRWIVSYRKLTIKRQVMPKDRPLELQEA